MIIIFFLHVHVLFDLKMIIIYMCVNKHIWIRQQTLHISMLSPFILSCKSLFLVYEYYELFWLISYKIDDFSPKPILFSYWYIWTCFWTETRWRDMFSYRFTSQWEYADKMMTLMVSLNKVVEILCIFYFF